MMFLLRQLAIFVVALAVLAGGSATKPQQPPGLERARPLTYSPQTCWRFRAAETAMVQRINAARNLRGDAALRLDRELSRVARVHSRAMISRNSVYHSPQQVLARRLTNWNVLGENVGAGGSILALHKAFMDSPDHRGNVLYDPFRHVGVGVVRSGGRMWVTVLFESRRDPGTTLRMPSC